MNKTLLLLAVIVFFSCQHAVTPETEVNEELQLAFGEEISIPEQGISLTFSDILEDSRCPTGVQCVWAGNAKIAIQLNKKEGTLNSYLDPKQTILKGFTVTLISVTPYPQENDQIDKEDYVISLSVKN